MSETSISRTAVQQRSWCWGILKRREHKCDLYADVHDVQVHAFIYHLSLLSSSEFLCALTQGVPPAKWSCCYLQSCPMLPWFHKVTLHPPAHTKPPWCIQTHPLDPLRCHWQVALYHWVSVAKGQLRVRRMGPGCWLSGHTGGSQGDPVLVWGLFFHGDCFVHWDVTMLAAAPAFLDASQLEIVIKESSPLCYWRSLPEKSTAKKNKTQNQ